MLGGSIGAIAATFIRVKVENDGMSLDEVRVRPKILLALASISFVDWKRRSGGDSMAPN